MLRERQSGGDARTTSVATGGSRSATATAAAPSSHRLLTLQRQAGNRAVSREVLAIQRDHTDDPDDFIQWITGRKAYTDYANLDGVSAKDACHKAGKAVQLDILEAGIPVAGHVYLIWKPDAQEDDAPGDHVVCVATVAGTEVVVDPTRQQFGPPACAMRLAQWRQEFLNAIPQADGIAVRTFTGVETARYWLANPFCFEAWNGDPNSVGANLIRAAGGGGGGGGHHHGGGNRCAGCTIL